MTRKKVKVDIYLILRTPDGKYYFFPSWHETPEKIDVELPAEFYLPATIFLNVKVPSPAPPLFTLGNYAMFIALTEAGTVNFYSLDAVSFNIGV